MIQIGVMPITALLMTVASNYGHGFKARTPEEFNGAAKLYMHGSFSCGLLGAVVLLLLGPAFLEFTRRGPMPIFWEVLQISFIVYLVIGLLSPFSAVLPFIGSEKAYFHVNLIAFNVALTGSFSLIP